MTSSLNRGTVQGRDLEGLTEELGLGLQPTVQFAGELLDPSSQPVGHAFSVQGSVVTFQGNLAESGPVGGANT